MENTQPPAWKLMKPRPTQLRPQARLGLGPPRIFYRPCLDCSSVSTRPRLLRYSPTATVLTPCSPSPTALRHSLIRFHFSSSRCVPLAHSALQYRYAPCPMGGTKEKNQDTFSARHHRRSSSVSNDCYLVVHQDPTSVQALFPQQGVTERRFSSD